jgi:Resolvase, N terminal domain
MQAAIYLRVSTIDQTTANQERELRAVAERMGADVTGFEIEILNADNEVTYRNSSVTNLEVGPGNVAALAACGRARWKIENETFNVLKTKGYHIEHNFGHGEQHLASVLVP